MTIFGLKVMVKSGLEKIILKFHVPLQSCYGPVQKNLPREAEFAWLVSRYLLRGKWNFKIIFSRPLFTIIFKPKMVISRLKILITYSSHSKWCDHTLIFWKKYSNQSSEASVTVSNVIRGYQELHKFGPFLSLTASKMDFGGFHW